jgi:hypothetical protein
MRARQGSAVPPHVLFVARELGELDSADLTGVRLNAVVDERDVLRGSVILPKIFVTNRAIVRNRGLGRFKNFRGVGVRLDVGLKVGNMLGGVIAFGAAIYARTTDIAVVRVHVSGKGDRAGKRKATELARIGGRIDHGRETFKLEMFTSSLRLLTHYAFSRKTASKMPII